MIQVFIPPNFIRERVYAIHVLLYQFLGLQYAINTAQESQAYRFEFDGKRVVIADRFFRFYNNKDKSYLVSSAIPDSVTFAKHPALDRIPVIYGDDHFEESKDSITCGVDIIASTFFMLSRWEEFVVTTRDLHGRFPGTASLAAHAGFIDRPVVNTYADLLKGWLMQIGVPISAFRKRSFQLTIHCDVDTALYWPSRFSVVNKVFFQLLKQYSLKGALAEIAAYRVFQKNRHDLYDTFDRVMDLAEQHQTKARFYFLVGRHHKFDSDQVLKEPHVERIFQHITQRGHGTGIHFSYLTADNPTVMQNEAKQFESQVQKRPVHARQHYLRCSVPHTWRGLEEAGISVDSTMGYPEMPGFRCGSCYPFPLFDIEKRRMLHLYERPLIAMDVTFKMYRKSTPEKTEVEMLSLLETVRSYEGEFILLWHNSSFAGEWETWQHIPENVLQRSESNKH